MKIELFTFDLDGTLLDTAHDFLKAVNILREKYNLEEADFNEVRSRVSQGAGSLATYALSAENESPDQVEIYRQELLDIYEECCLDETRLFDGIEDVLNCLNENKIKWGIMTNKPRRFAEGIVDQKLSLFQTPFLICPDDVNARKPDPSGLIRALEISSVSPSESIYIGEHQIDIKAGKSAGMTTGAAGYGYIPINDHIDNWGADYNFNQPIDILKIIKS